MNVRRGLDLERTVTTEYVEIDDHEHNKTLMFGSMPPDIKLRPCLGQHSTQRGQAALNLRQIGGAESNYQAL
jgi:hypothetical protein